jgi:hypothetical protein
VTAAARRDVQRDGDELLELVVGDTRAPAREAVCGERGRDAISLQRAARPDGHPGRALRESGL